MATAAATQPRLAWVDTVKATSVLLVVVLHLTQVLAGTVGDTFSSEFWRSFSLFLEPFRMPTFFVVSGMLAAGAVNRPWRMTKARTIGIGYLFLLWFSIYTVSTFAVGHLITDEAPGVGQTIATFFRGLLLPPGGYWYLWALVVYFVLARLLRNLPMWPVLAVAASLNLARPWVLDFLQHATEPFGSKGMMDAVLINFVYFMVGVYFSAWLKRQSTTAPIAALPLLAAAAIGGSTVRLLNPHLWGYSFLPLALAWIGLSILAFHVLSQNQAVARFGSYIGARTLPIFVLQFPVIYVFSLILRHHPTLLTDNPWAQFAFPVAGTAFIAVGSLLLYKAAMGTWAQPLFKAPEQWTAATPAPIKTPGDSGTTDLVTAAGESIPELAKGADPVELGETAAGTPAQR